MPRRKFEQMPFEHDDGLDSPKRKKAKECDPKPRRTMKQKQRSWVLTGLKHLRAPAVIGMLASLVFACGGLDFSATQHFETFAGRMEVTKAEMEAGRHAIPFEIELDPFSQDILSPQGFANAVYQILRLEPGSGSLHAPVCSTWVFMSRGSTLRSADSPLGRPDSEKVHQGNVMTARVMILFLLAAAKGIWSILEQPGSSIMELHPTMQRLLQLLQIHRLRIKMKDFGGESDKATLLYSSHREIDDLIAERKPSRVSSGSGPQMTVRYIDGSGKQRCKGGCDLKKSQHYPRGFARALSKIRSNNKRKIRSQAKKFLKEAANTKNRMDKRPRENAHWVKHADLNPVFAYLVENGK